MPSPRSAAKAKPSARRRQAPRPPSGHWRLLGWLLTALLVLVTFTLALIADTASVARLVWACLAGQLGTSPQIVVAGLAATVLTACAIAWWPSRRSSGPSARRQAGSTGGRSGGTRATAARKPAERRKQTRTHEAKT